MAKEGKHAADHKLILALICGATPETAAQKAGVSIRTLRRRMRDPRFVRKLDRKRGEMLLRSADQLTAAHTVAVRTLIELMQTGNGGQVRRGAARAVIELSMKVRETADLVERLSQLEQRVAQQK